MIPIQDQASLEELFARLRAVEQAHARIAQQLDVLLARLSKQSGEEEDLMPKPRPPVSEVASALTSSESKQQDSRLIKLTAREVEVLRLVAQGLTDAEVATRLVLAPRTVNWYLTCIYSKLGVSSRTAATRYVLEQQFFQKNL